MEEVVEIRNGTGLGKRGWVGLVLMSSVLTIACEAPGVAREYFRDPTPHEAYTLGLGQAGLLDTALGREWWSQAAGALAQAPSVGSPFEEEGFFPPEEPLALGYRFELRRGQQVNIEVALDSTRATRLFVDLYRAAPDSTRVPVPVMAGGNLEQSFEYESTRDAEYILRIQPELLRGGRYRMSLRVDGALAFPVQGRNTRAILSFFGDERDAGRRSHNGVDIFAPRGTPVLAVADGVVSRVETTNLGGLVVWTRDPGRHQSHYYAHLNSQTVRAGERVRRGDQVGTVGNTGNARTTATHLHFGVYQRRVGPINPWYYLYRPGGQLPELSADVGRLGEWVQVKNDEIRLRARPSLRGSVVAELERHTAVHVIAANGSWYRVRLSDGQFGFLAARLTESIVEPTVEPLRHTAAEGLDGS